MQPNNFSSANQGARGDRVQWNFLNGQRGSYFPQSNAWTSVSKPDSQPFNMNGAGFQNQTQYTNNEIPLNGTTHLTSDNIVSPNNYGPGTFLQQPSQYQPQMASNQPIHFAEQPPVEFKDFTTIAQTPAAPAGEFTSTNTAKQSAPNSGQPSFPLIPSFAVDQPSFPTNTAPPATETRNQPTQNASTAPSLSQPFDTYQQPQYNQIQTQNQIPQQLTIQPNTVQQAGYPQQNPGIFNQSPVFQNAPPEQARQQNEPLPAQLGNAPEMTTKIGTADQTVLSLIDGQGGWLADDAKKLWLDNRHLSPSQAIARAAVNYSGAVASQNPNDQNVQLQHALDVNAQNAVDQSPWNSDWGSARNQAQSDWNAFMNSRQQGGTMDPNIVTAIPTISPALDEPHYTM